VKQTNRFAHGFRGPLAFLAASALGLATFAGPLARTASAQEVVVDFPTADFLTTVQPVYYENHAAYWWHNRWVYRDGAGWRGYATEPAFLAQRRMHDPPGRWFYGQKDAHGSGAFGHDEHGGHGGHDEPKGGHEDNHPADGHGGHEQHGGGKPGKR
jgi:hypothetical protein